MEHEQRVDNDTMNRCIELAQNENKIAEINKSLDENPALSIEETSKLNLQLNVLLETSSQLEDALREKGITHHDALLMGRAKIEANNNLNDSNNLRASA